MHQIVQYSGDGRIAVADVPEPLVSRGSVKIRTLHSVISAGTERTKVEMGEKSLLGKARARPDLVSKVIQKARNEGLWSTFEAVRNRLAEASPLGYSLAGIVTEVGADARGVRPGDLVAAAGAGFANHADYVVVPHTLVTRVPEGVDSESAAFTTLGAIALQGVRQANPLIGETFLVVGLGLIGLLTCQLLRANGCRVLAYDLSEQAVARAEAFGAIPIRPDEDALTAATVHTGGYGVDGTIITASTASDAPIVLAGDATREKGRVVVVGLVPVNLPREPYYMKEIDVRLSRSYGPGRYDRQHEEGGIDYPFAYVRFTEGRNMQAFLSLLAQKAIDMAPLITHRYPIAEAATAYELLSGARKEPYLGIVISYPDEAPDRAPRTSAPDAPAIRRESSQLAVAFVGAGNYAVGKLLPILKAEPGVTLGRLCTASGRSASDIRDRFGFQGVANSPQEIITGDEQAVFIATRHSSHAELTALALAHGKHVFVEKPLAISDEELAAVEIAYRNSPGQLLVGFNRRFAPFTLAARRHFGAAPVEAVSIRVNVGTLPAGHWSLDPKEGGRIVGEACHFVDLAAALIGSAPARVFAIAPAFGAASPASAETSAIQILMRNGAIATIDYIAGGSSQLAKERIECHGGGKSAVIDDFRVLSLYDAKGMTSKKAQQDKGQKEMLSTFLSAMRTGQPAIAASDIFAVSAATLAIVTSSCTGQPVAIADFSELNRRRDI